MADPYFTTEAEQPLVVTKPISAVEEPTFFDATTPPVEPTVEVQQEPAKRWTPADLSTMVNEPEFQSSTTDEKNEMIDFMSSNIYDSLQSEGFTDDYYKDYADLIDTARGNADPSFLSKAGTYVKDLGRDSLEMGKGFASIPVGVAATLASPFSEGAADIRDTSIDALANSASNLVGAGIAFGNNYLDSNTRKLNERASSLADKLRTGDLSTNPDKLLSQLKEYDTELNPMQIKHHGSNIAKENSILNPKQVSRVAEYQRTRNPKLLEAIVDDLTVHSTTVQNQQKRSELTNTEGAKAFEAMFGAGSSKHLVSGMDVLNFAMGAGAVGKIGLRSVLLRFLPKEATERVLASKYLTAAMFSGEMGAYGVISTLAQDPNADISEVSDGVLKSILMGGVINRGVHYAGKGIKAVRGSGEKVEATPTSEMSFPESDSTLTNLASDVEPIGETAKKTGSGQIYADPAGLVLVTDSIRIFAREAKSLGAFAKKMLNYFGEWIKPHIKALFAAAKDGAAAIRAYVEDLAAVAQSNGGFINIKQAKQGLKSGTVADKGEKSAIFYQGEGAFRVQYPTIRAILRGGLLPKGLLDIVTLSNSAKNAVNSRASQLAGDLNEAIKRSANKYNLPVEQVMDSVSAGMTDPALLAVMSDPVLKQATYNARSFLDKMSSEIAAMTTQQAGSTILQNLGSWMRQGYAAFDHASGWNYDALVSSAKSGKLIGGKNASKILGDAEALLKRENPNATAGEIEAMMRNITDRDQWLNAVGGKSVSKDVTSLMQRKVIPPEIKALMGEITNPLERFAASASFQAQFIALHKAQESLRDVGLKMGVFKTTPDGVHNQQVDPSRGITGQRRSGFGSDLYTTPEMMNALANTKGVMTGTDLAGWIGTAVKFIGGQAKLNNVALNPDSWIINLIGNAVGLVASGDALMLEGYKNMKKAVELMRSAKALKGDEVLNLTGQMRQMQRGMLNRLEAEGVISGGLEMQDVLANLDNRLLQFIEGDKKADMAMGVTQGGIIGQSLGASFGSIGRGVGGILGAAIGSQLKGTTLNKFQKTMGEYLLSKPDNWAKIASLLSNYSTHLKAGMQDGAAFKLAVQKTMDTLPDYSKLPPFVRELSRLGVTGSFIAFQWETYRNAFNNVKYAMQELKSGNVALMDRGARRLFGVSLILGVSFLGLNGLIEFFGVTNTSDEKDEAYRRSLGRPWDRFSRLAYSKLDNKQATYMNTSYLLPQATIKEVIAAALEGRTLEEGLSNAVSQLGDQFVGGSIHADPILEALMNERKFGGKVSTENGVRNFLERLDHVLVTTTVPGYVKKADRVTRAVMGRSKGDRVFTTDQEIQRLLGLRKATYTHEQSMMSRLYTFKDRMDDAKQVAKRAYSDWGKANPDAIGLSEQQRAVVRANEMIAEIKSDFIQWNKDLATLGITPADIRRVQKSRGVYFNITPIQIGKQGIEADRALPPIK